MLLYLEGSWLSKPCAIGSVGFPILTLKRHRFEQFPIKQDITPNRHLGRTIIPIQPALSNSLEVFLDRKQFY